MILVFVCGPYWHDDPCIRLAHVFRAMYAAVQLVQLGYAVYCPHLWHYAPQDGITEAMWREQDIAWLLVSDMLLRLPGESDGADDEVALAKQNLVAIRFSLDDFPNLLEGRVAEIEK